VSQDKTGTHFDEKNTEIWRMCLERYSSPVVVYITGILCLNMDGTSTTFLSLFRTMSGVNEQRKMCFKSLIEAKNVEKPDM
jgi:hypothetical protein